MSTNSLLQFFLEVLDPEVGEKPVASAMRTLALGQASNQIAAMYYLRRALNHSPTSRVRHLPRVLNGLIDSNVKIRAGCGRVLESMHFEEESSTPSIRFAVPFLLEMLLTEETEEIVKAQFEKTILCMSGMRHTDFRQLREGGNPVLSMLAVRMGEALLTNIRLHAESTTLRQTAIDFTLGVVCDGREL